MHTIETEGVVSSDGELSLQIRAPGITPGKHRLLVIIDEPVVASEKQEGQASLELPLLPSGRWQGASLKREDLYGDDGR